MIKEIEENYNIKVNNIIKITDKVWEVNSSSNSYILKIYENRLLESVFSRLFILGITEFLLPIKMKDNRFFIKIDGKDYALFRKVYEDDYEAKEIKLNYYINAIGNLHNKTKYLLKVSDGYFKEIIAYIDGIRERVKSDIINRAAAFEQSTYHSPREWFFYMNYYRLFNAIRESERYTSLLEEEKENIKNIRLSLTYQNFSFEHILPKENIIVSLSKMAYGTPVYDLIDLIDKMYIDKCDISFLISEYEERNKLELYEKYYLFAYLYIPLYRRFEDEVEDIEALSKCLERISLVNDISSNYFEENS